jgi:ATP dependent DNA ligase domain
MPCFIEPMLARSGPIPDGDDWALEVKFDGMRAQLRWDGRGLCLRSRPGRDCSVEFPELQAIADALGSRRVILDGELVCFGDDGHPDFERLRGRLRAQSKAATAASARAPATFLAFDLLHLERDSRLELPYAARRELLEGLDLEGPAWRTPRHFVGQADAVLSATRSRASRASSPSGSTAPTSPASATPPGEAQAPPHGALPDHRLVAWPTGAAGELLPRQAAERREPRARRERLARALGRGSGAAAGSARGRRATAPQAPTKGSARRAGSARNGRLPRAGARASTGPGPPEGGPELVGRPPRCSTSSGRAGSVH